MCLRLRELVRQRRIRSVNSGEAISVIFAVKSHNGFATVREMTYTSQHCCDKQWTAKWPYIANVVFRIVKIMMNEVAFAGF